jgi:hypothetical protein
MKMINLERVFMSIGLVTALFAMVVRFSQGFSAYAWPLASALWILTCWIKTERLESITKNK